MNSAKIVFCLFFFLSIFYIQAVFAQENPEDNVRKYNITFPVEVLGGCASIATCRTYCEDVVHAESCINFAKSKGFYKEEQLNNHQSELLEKAKGELGCDSPDSCRALCHQESNFEKCGSFAKKYNISGGHTENPTEQRFLEKAKQILGCDSPQSCKTFCEDETHRTQCTEFAKEVGLRGGEHFVGPGGCTSPETCQSFCGNPDNFQICASFSSHGNNEKFSGPGGCNSEESCRAYCEKNPQECRHTGEGVSSQVIYNKEEMCNRTPQCSWENNTCQCGFNGGIEEYAKFCRDNPEKCKITTTTSTGTYPTETSGGDSATECVKYGCSWNGTNCQCSQSQTTNTGSTVQPTGYSQPTSSPQSPTSSVTTDPATECGKNSGCLWTGSTCQCNNSPQPTIQTSGNLGGDPATECVKYTGCTWTGSNCQCSQVQGIETEKPKMSFLQFIFNLLFGK